MSTGLELTLIALCVVASGIYSGSETGFYSLSRVRVDLEARRGHWSARLVRRLLQNESALLITILIGNNLVVELATHLGDEVAAGYAWPDSLRKVIVIVLLTPVLFFFGEALPKDLFRVRPHGLIGIVAPFIAVSRVLFWPLERLLTLLSSGLARLFGLEGETALSVAGNEAVLHMLAEGRRSGALSERAEILAANALGLRSTPIHRAMVPWPSVVHLPSQLDQAELYERVRQSEHTRLPVVEPSGACLGYIHQLEVLADGPEVSVLEKVRTLPSLALSVPVDRALLTLRGTGQRAAVVTGPEGPVGLVTLKDLVEEISGELAGW